MFPPMTRLLLFALSAALALFAAAPAAQAACACTHYASAQQFVQFNDVIFKGKAVGSKTQYGVTTTTFGTSSIGTLQASLLGLGKARQHIIKQGGKLVQPQPGHLQEDGRIAAQIVEATDHARPQPQQGPMEARPVYSIT